MKRLVSACFAGVYPFSSLAPDQEPISTSDPDDLKEGDVLIVWGGADISPDLYNKKMSSRSHAWGPPSHRDKVEWALMNRAREKGIPIIGICRGAQMLCALAGGYLIQDITDHAGPNHLINTVNGAEYVVNSLHHQMMVPGSAKHEMLGWTDKRRSRHYYDEDVLVDIEIEPELVLFNEVKGIGAQWHPEMMHRDQPATKMLLQTIREKL